MSRIYVSTILESIAVEHDVVLGVLGESAGEFMFHSINSLYLFHNAPMFRLVFDWPEAFYTSNFFECLFHLMLTNEGCDYFCEIMRQSDLCPKSEVGLLAITALEALQTSPEIVLD